MTPRILPLALAAMVSMLGTALLPAQSSVKVAPETEKVINGALKYLAAQQRPNGAWVGVNSEEQKYPIAMTGYTLIAFLAAGHLPGEGEYGANVAKGVKFLLASITDEGLFDDGKNGHYMYYHGIATIALAELYGQSPNSALRAKLDKVVRIILSSQNHEGGWRYRPFVADADISVTVLQVVALRAAKNGGLNVPQSTIDKAVAYVRSCYMENDGGFAYQPGQGSGFARTAAAIYSLQVCGQYDDPRVAAGSKYLLEKFRTGDRWFTYGNFYAAPAQYMIGGDTWKQWYAKIKEPLLERVVRSDDGLCHWDKGLDGSSPGPTFSTAVYTMILAMPYHYIPLYQR